MRYFTDKQKFFYFMSPSSGGGAPIYPLNAINLNQTDQYLELQGITSRLDIGTQTLAVFSKVPDPNAQTVIYSKSESPTSLRRVEIIAAVNKIFFIVHAGAGPDPEATYSTTNAVLTDPNSHVAVYWDRTSTSSSSVNIYVNRQKINDITTDSLQGDPTSYNYTTAQPLFIGRRLWDSVNIYGKAPVFTKVLIGQSITQADVDYDYNGGDPLCATDYATDNPTLYSKFDEWFDLGIYNGSTETQALTGKINGWQFNNVNNAPFNLTGLNVECST